MHGMKRRPKWTKRWARIYRWLMLKGYEHCRVCGSKENLTFDHIVPRAFGGSNEITNITILCDTCNNTKGHSYWHLEALTWPPPLFTIKQGADVRVDDVLFYGKVVHKAVVCDRPDVRVWACYLDRQYAMIDRSDMVEVVSTEEYFIVPRSFYGDITRMACSAELGQAR